MEGEVKEGWNKQNMNIPLPSQSEQKVNLSASHNKKKEDRGWSIELNAMWEEEEEEEKKSVGQGSTSREVRTSLKDPEPGGSKHWQSISRGIYEIGLSFTYFEIFFKKVF